MKSVPRTPNSAFDFRSAVCTCWDTLFSPAPSLEVDDTVPIQTDGLAERTRSPLVPEYFIRKTDWQWDCAQYAHPHQYSVLCRLRSNPLLINLFAYQYFLKITISLIFKNLNIYGVIKHKKGRVRSQKVHSMGNIHCLLCY